MKVAIVSQQYPPETVGGGIGTQAFLKARGLARRGHEIYVLTYSGGARRERREGDVTVIGVERLTPWLEHQSEPMWWLGHSVAVAREIERLDGEVGLDVIDFPEYACEGLVHLLNRGGERRVPSVVHLHGPLVMLARTIGWPELDSALYRGGVALERAYIQLADKLYSSSLLSAEWCATEYGVDAASIPVIHLGVDTELFRPDRGAKAERPTICFVGRVAESKGADLLVATAIDLAVTHPNIELVLVGEGEQGFIERLRAEAERAGFPHLLRFTGFLDHRELANELARAHVFAAPSLYEGGPGLVYLEAMACGLPVVAPSGSGVEEVITDQETGLLVAPRDHGALAAAIERLLNEPGLCADLGSAGRAFVVDRHDTAIGVERLEAFLESARVAPR